MPIFFGMRKYSVPATIISSVIIVMVMSSTTSEFSLSSIMYIPLSLAAAGFVFAYLAVRKVDKTDVL